MLVLVEVAVVVAIGGGAFSVVVVTVENDGIVVPVAPVAVAPVAVAPVAVAVAVAPVAVAVAVVPVAVAPVAVAPVAALKNWTRTSFFSRAKDFLKWGRRLALSKSSFLDKDCNDVMVYVFLCFDNRV